eukprot:4468614-Pyramimonas_sp.AAC.1
MRYVSAALWRCILYNRWLARGHIDSIVATGAQHITNELKKWVTENKEHATSSITRITVKMMGDKRGCSLARPNHPGWHMSLKAAECGMLVRFATHLVLQLGGVQVFGGALVQAGASLIQYVDQMRAIGVVPAGAEHNNTLASAQVHLAARRACGMPFVPKHHLFAHMTDRRCGLKRRESHTFPPRPARPAPTPQAAR